MPKVVERRKEFCEKTERRRIAPSALVAAAETHRRGLASLAAKL